MDYDAIDYGEARLRLALTTDNIEYDGLIYKDGYIGSAGGSQAHNNMPPYLVVNIWKRTA